MKIVSWNVNGIRAVMKKGFDEIFQNFNADVVCLQETKAQDEQVIEALKGFDNYHLFCNSAEKKGYAGTTIISKSKPLGFIKDMGIEEHDNEGRISGVEFDQFYIINVYVPNSGSELIRLDYRQKWDEDFLNYLKNLEQKKPVIVVGDFNVANKEIDLARPKPNYNKSAGYMQEEIDGFDNFTNNDLVDTFRYVHPEEIKYSWWSYRANARGKNVGWRIDYVLTSKKIIDDVTSAFILNDVFGSDHCPVGIDINLN